MYLNAGANVINNIDKYLDIAKNNGVNAIVVDIKDGALAYSSEVAKEISPTAYNTAINDNDLYRNNRKLWFPILDSCELIYTFLFILMILFCKMHI